MKVDMFKDILPAINKGDKNFYNKLPLEARKSSFRNLAAEITQSKLNDELNLLKEMNTENDFQNLAKEMGYSDKQISDIFDGKRRSKKS